MAGVFCCLAGISVVFPVNIPSMAGMGSSELDNSTCNMRGVCVWCAVGCVWLNRCQHSKMQADKLQAYNL